MLLMILRIFRRVELWVLVAILFLSSLYLYLFPAPNLTYVAVVLFHAGLGVIAVAVLVPKLVAVVRAKSLYRDLGWLVFAAGAILGLVLLFIGTIRSHWSVMYAHVALSFAGVALLLVKWIGTRGWQLKSRSLSLVTTGLCLAVAAGAAYGGWQIR